MSKAEKMFNELGFRKDDLSKIKSYDEIVRYSKVKKGEEWYNEKLLMSITLIKVNGNWEIDIYNHKGKIQKIKQKDLKVIQAITEQMKELGWLE